MRRTNRRTLVVALAAAGGAAVLGFADFAYNAGQREYNITLLDRIMAGDVGYVRRAIANGARLDYGSPMTPLECAAEYHQHEIADMLRRAGAQR